MKKQEGALPGSSKLKAPPNRLHNPWGSSNGRTPGLTIEAIPVRIRVPKLPGFEWGPRCANSKGPDHQPRDWAPKRMTCPTNIAVLAIKFHPAASAPLPLLD